MKQPKNAYHNKTSPSGDRNFMVRKRPRRVKGGTWTQRTRKERETLHKVIHWRMYTCSAVVHWLLHFWPGTDYSDICNVTVLCWLLFVLLPSLFFKMCSLWSSFLGVATQTQQQELKLHKLALVVTPRTLHKTCFWQLPLQFLLNFKHGLHKCLHI